MNVQFLYLFPYLVSLALLYFVIFMELGPSYTFFQKLGYSTIILLSIWLLIGVVRILLNRKQFVREVRKTIRLWKKS